MANNWLHDVSATLANLNCTQTSCIVLYAVDKVFVAETSYKQFLINSTVYAQIHLAS